MLYYLGQTSNDILTCAKVYVLLIEDNRVPICHTKYVDVVQYKIQN